MLYLLIIHYFNSMGIHIYCNSHTARHIIPAGYDFHLPPQSMKH